MDKRELDHLVYDQMQRRVPVDFTGEQAIAMSAQCADAIELVQRPISRMLKETKSTAAPRSQAVADRTGASDVSGPWNDDPISEAIQLVAMELVAAQEAMASYAAVLRALPAGMFAFQTLARSAVEYFAECYHLCNPLLTNRTRTQRTLATLIESHNEVVKRTTGATQLASQKAVATLQSSCVCLCDNRRVKGGKALKHKHFWNDEEIYLRQSALVKQLLGGQFGAKVYHLLSGPAHGEPWSLVASNIEAATIHLPDGSPFTPMGVEMGTVLFTTAIVLTAAEKAYLPAARWLGWDTTEFATAFDSVRPQVDEWLTEEPTYAERPPGIPVISVVDRDPVTRR